MPPANFTQVYFRGTLRRDALGKSYEVLSSLPFTSQTTRLLLLRIIDIFYWVRLVDTFASFISFLQKA
jgi:hypothetical protein